MSWLNRIREIVVLAAKTRESRLRFWRFVSHCRQFLLRSGMEKDRIDPTFWRKVVYVLDCTTCGEQVCRRGMRAILLADTSIELFSTDAPDTSKIGVVPQIFMTAHCNCKIQNIACLCCGSVVGYHVLTPCRKCMRSCNNGHFWMFHSNCISPSGRVNLQDGDYMTWKDLPAMEEDDATYAMECFR